MVLNAAATTKWPGITPAPLPPVGFLDRNQGQLKNETFTLVGYGVDIGPKKTQIINQSRFSTTSFLQNVQSELVMFSSAPRTRRRAADRASAIRAGPCPREYVLGDART